MKKLVEELNHQKIICVFCDKEIMFIESNETQYGPCCDKCLSDFTKLGWNEGLELKIM